MNEMNEQSGTAPRGNFFKRLIWTFVSPKLLYADIAAGAAKWWEPWVWVSLISMGTAYLSIPIQIQLTRMNPKGVPQEQLDQSLAMMEKFGFLGVISWPVVALVSSLIITGISYIVLSMLAEESRFKRYFTLYLYSSIVASLGMLLATGISVMKGVENIRSMEDASTSFGPAVLIPAEQKILHAVMSTGFDIFQIWFYLLIGAGVVSIFKVGKGAAALVVLPVWLVFLLVTLLSMRFGG
jgi:hypothetical protein